MTAEKTIRETPDKVCAKMIEMAALGTYMRILEPSAGKGKIVSYIEDNYSFEGNAYTLIELNKEKCEYMESIRKPQQDWSIFRADFLQYEEDTNDKSKFDRIIACPPFKANVDILHIQKMYDVHLHKKGLMVSLTSPYWITNNEPHQVKFREWLADKDYYMRMLPENSFMEKGRSVPTAIIKIYKK